MEALLSLKSLNYNFYHTVPLVLRSSRQVIVVIAGYW
jgi:hypothetical protein